MARPKKYPPNHKFTRNCPDCNVIIEYKTSSQYYQSIKLNRKCRKCGSGWSRGQTKETNESLQKMSKKVSAKLKGKSPWNKGLTKDLHTSLQVVGNKRKGKKHSTETLQKISEASINHWADKRYRKLVSDKVKQTRGNPDVIAKWRKTGEDNGNFVPLEQKTEWERYIHLVWYYTNKNDLTTLDNHHLRGRIDMVTNAYHLDHIVSITDGFNNNVPPEIIGSIYNLRFISAVDNMNKKQRSDMKIETLLESYYGE